MMKSRIFSFTSRPALLLRVAATLAALLLPSLAGAADQYPPLPAWDSRIEHLVERDSSNWIFNRFDRGSVHDSYQMAVSQDRRTIIVAADYTFNQGMKGQVAVVVTDDQAICLEYWDKPGACRSYVPDDLAYLYDNNGGSNYSSGTSQPQQPCLPCYCFAAPGCGGAYEPQ